MPGAAEECGRRSTGLVPPLRRVRVLVAARLDESCGGMGVTRSGRRTGGGAGLWITAIARALLST